MYTTTIHTELTGGSEIISRFFETKKAAVKWFNWLKSQKMTISCSLYLGEAGAMLLERYTK